MILENRGKARIVYLYRLLPPATRLPKSRRDGGQEALCGGQVGSAGSGKLAMTTRWMQAFAGMVGRVWLGLGPEPNSRA